MNVAKHRGEDFNLTLVNFAAERFLYRLSCSRWRRQFVLKGAMLFAVRVGEAYRPTRDLDLMGRGEATPESIEMAVREIAAVNLSGDGLDFDLAQLQVRPIRKVTATAESASRSMPASPKPGFRCRSISASATR